MLMVGILMKAFQEMVRGPEKEIQVMMVKYVRLNTKMVDHSPELSTNLGLNLDLTLDA